MRARTCICMQAVVFSWGKGCGEGEYAKGGDRRRHRWWFTTAFSSRATRKFIHDTHTHREAGEKMGEREKKRQGVPERERVWEGALLHLIENLTHFATILRFLHGIRLIEGYLLHINGILTQRRRSHWPRLRGASLWRYIRIEAVLHVPLLLQLQLLCGRLALLARHCLCRHSRCVCLLLFLLFVFVV